MPEVESSGPSTCDVCLWGPDDIENDFSSETILRARKQHRCSECARVIEPGQQYERAVGKSDGSVWTIKTCLTCSEIRKVFYCNGTGWYYGSLWEDMGDQAFDRLTTASPCFTQLSPIAKDKVMEEWRKWKGLSP